MKAHLLLFALLAVLISTGCKNDDDNPTPDGILQHDGDNATGPILNIGRYEAAAMFPASLTSTTEFKDKSLTQVTWFMGNKPAACSVKIYGPGTNGQPGGILHEADVLNSVVAQQWTTYTLPTPITITGDDLWISISFRHDVQMQSIGCDAGPAADNGDWLFQDSDVQWLTYRTRTSESVNWNIRGITE